MKNVQIVDNSVSCIYPIHQFTDEQFAAIFPKPQQDVQFASDLTERLSERRSIVC